MIKRKWGIAATVALIVATTAFIWGQSLQTGTDSAETSGQLLTWLAGVFGDWLLQDGAHHLLRKCAHFAEFALLGGEWMALSRTCGRHVLWPVGALTAVVDECLQLFTPDRGPAVTDVLLDVAGYACGAAAVWLVWRRYRRKKGACNL